MAINLKKNNRLNARKPSSPRSQRSGFKRPPFLPTTDEQKGTEDTGLRVNGWGVRTTPRNRPISPLDCERYPDSPFCGGNPFTPKPISLDTKIVFDACAVGLQFSGSFGWIKTPEWQIILRKLSEDCEIPPPPEPPAPPRGRRGGLKMPYLNGDDYYLLFCNAEIYEYNMSYTHVDPATFDDFYGYRETPGGTTTSTGTKTKTYSITAELLEDGVGGCRIEVSQNFHETYSGSIESTIPGESASDSYENGYSNPLETLINGKNAAFTYVGNPGLQHHLIIPVAKRVWRVRALKEMFADGIFNGYEETPFIDYCYYGKGEDLAAYLSEATKDQESSGRTIIPAYNNPPFASGGGGETRYYGHAALKLDVRLAVLADAIRPEIGTELNWKLNLGLNYECQKEERPQPEIDPQNRPRQQPKRKKKPTEIKMTCNCDEMNRQLKLIYRALGMNPLRGETLSEAKLIRNDKKPGVTNKKSLTELMGHMLETLYNILGQWEVKYEINDIDPTKKGDQKEVIRLANLSSAVLELHRLQMRKEVRDTLINKIIIDLISELTSTKQILLQVHQNQLAQLEYLGFTTKEEAMEMPIPYTPNAIDNAEFLKDSTIKVPVLKFNGLNGQDINLQDNLKLITEAAIVIKGLFTKNLDKDNPEATVNALIEEKKKKLDATEEEVEKASSDFSDLLRTMEQGFNEQPGMNGINEFPWSEDKRTYKIREIAPQNDDNDTDT